MSGKNAVRVAVPVKLARLRVWVDKGRHWSGVDRLILWALAAEPSTAGELAKVARIPARLIAEIILRMMRFGWVELAAAPKGASFRATEAGREVVETFATLPPVTRRIARRISFSMEPFAWRAYGLRDLKPYRSGEIESIERGHDVRRVVIDGGWGRLSSLKLYAAADQVLADDEELSSVDYSASDTVDQFALFTVIGDSIKGLPPDPAEQLVSAIRRAAKENKPGAALTIKPPRRAIISTDAGNIVRTVPIRPDDIVLSGQDHRDRLIEILRQARSRLIMHSTFLREGAFIELQAEFARAAKRGVRIDIFWGADRDESDRTANLEAAIAINHRITADQNLRGRARVHLYTTRSHAKLLIADATGRAADEFVAVVGSCNWLYSGFNRVEASVVLRHPHAVAQVAQECAELIFDVATSSETASDLTSLARTLRTHTAPEGDAELRLIRGDDHAELMRLARETAEKSIMVGGDRLGLAAEARTIIPMMAAAKRSVQGLICYSKPSGPVTQKDAKDLATLAGSVGVRLLQIRDRELHGKFLLWDDDHLVITSLNWSSADTRFDSPLGEIGVYIKSPGVADNIRRRLIEGWPSLDPQEAAAHQDRIRSKRRKRRSRGSSAKGTASTG
ncbi:phospholipase D-like domain-containing protein [Methylocystis parvus]|uniref:Phospholipase D n=1 Tax=Methylocystis parvus TaxID=134 RepID=A0A6B8MAT6_9HYPH|nr:phospholipase D-like domain-containing protein [Methylocystis parvus]QGM99816.1 phosphatidylserine synthase [Methylocystis parvus]WBK02236.1 phospholipase D-like domain-containing protein [Methylocystis parvus OBBP]